MTQLQVPGRRPEVDCLRTLVYQPFLPPLYTHSFIRLFIHHAPIHLIILVLVPIDLICRQANNLINVESE